MRIGIDCRKAADFGIGTYIRGLVGALAKMKLSDEIILLAPAAANELLPDSFERVEEASAGYSIKELFSVGSTATRLQLDVFHSPHYVIPFTVVPIVVTIHDLTHLKVSVWRKHPLAPLYARRMIGRAVRKSARIITGSEAVRQEITARYPEAQPKIAVTRYGVDSRFRPGPASVEVLRKFRVEARSYFFFAGNDKPHKNLDRLVEAYRRFRERHPEIRLLIAGGSTRFRSEGIESAGFVADEELPELYRGAIALVQPSLEEGFGLPIVEAMASGTPAIVSERPVLVEVGGDAVLAVDPTSPTAISDAMERFIIDRSLRDRLSANALRRAHLFSWRECAEQTLEIYRRAVSMRVA
jgi:glycosyltransferase involved in cell wall biosynthesis